MKPKRRSTFSPRRSNAKRRRIADSASPVRRKSSSDSGAVRAPPEYIAFNYEEACPTFSRLLAIDSDGLYEQDDLLNLQYEVESMLAEVMMPLRRSTGELEFLHTGDYPKEDLRNRALPNVCLRPPVEPVSPTTIHEKEGVCGLPVDELDDDIDVHPPAHIPPRFWNWCNNDFMKQIDSDFLQDFKSTVVDKFDQESFRAFYVNEPWKHRKHSKSHGRMRVGSGSRVKKTSDVSEKVDKTPVSRKNGLRNQKSVETTPVNGSKIVPIIGSIVSAACRELRKNSFRIFSRSIDNSERNGTTPSRRHSGRLQSRDEPEQERRSSICIKSEPVDLSDDEQVNGITIHSPKMSPRVLSPRPIKKEIVDDDWERPGPSNGFHSPAHCNGINGYSNGKTNGELKSPKRKNGELRSNVISSMCNGNGLNKSVDFSFDNDEHREETINDFEAKAIGAKIVNKLITGGVLPESSANIFEEMSQQHDADESEFKISEDGRIDADDQELDELSAEMQRLQLELREFEPVAHALTSMVWRRAKAHYAYWETLNHLQHSEYDLFRLGVNMYREFPRRLPNITEQPILKAALKRRNAKARIFYGKCYRRLPRYRCKPQVKS